MGDVAEACQLMRQALEILDARGEHQCAALLDTVIHRLPGTGSDEAVDWSEGMIDTSSHY